MSEAELIYDDVNDVDEELAWLDYLTKERAGIMKDRERRLVNLKGKFVVVCDGKNQPLCLQDRRISSHYWTKFLSNALSFSDIDSVKAECSKYKYNNPRVVLVDEIYNLIPV